MTVLEVILPDDRIEEEPALRQAGARLGSQVALRIDQRVALLVDGRVELASDQDFQAVEVPKLPVIVGEAEHRVAAKQALGVDPHGALQIVFDQAQHLVRLVDLHGMPLQAVVLAQCSHASNVDAGNCRCTEIDGDPGRLAMRKRLEHGQAGRSWGCQGCHRGTPLLRRFCVKRTGISGMEQRDGDSPAPSYRTACLSGGTRGGVSRGDE